MKIIRSMRQSLRNFSFFQKEKQKETVDTIELVRKEVKIKKNVEDTSRKLVKDPQNKRAYKKSSLFFGIVFLLSIFYSVPVIQMVFRFSYEEKSTGNQDICYFNDLCRRSLGSINDFNHIFRERINQCEEGKSNRKVHLRLGVEGENKID